MTTRVLFIHGAGGIEAFDADGKLVASLRRELGRGYDVRYPQMPTKGGYESWKKKIAEEMSVLAGEVALVGHSHGGSVLLKYLLEERLDRVVRGLFLVAPPYWGAPDWEVDEFALPRDLGPELPGGLPVFFYFNQDDDVVPHSHLEEYRSRLPAATYRSYPRGGHQFDDGLSQVAKDLVR